MRKEYSKNDLDYFMNELAKEFKKITHRKANAEIILVGGASILINYDFRNMTTDFDAEIYAPSAIKDAMNHTRNKLNLSSDWLNEDFKKTSSYTPKLAECAKYYRTFANVLTVRTISDEYLIAMKLQSGRKYKHDLSDIVGILMNHQKNGNIITIEKIKNAYEQLYDNWNNLPEELQDFALQMTQCKSLPEKFDEISQKEALLKATVINFEEQYPNVLTNQNEDEIISLLENKLQNQIKQNDNNKKEQNLAPSFIALCGIPGSGKSEKAEEIAQAIPNTDIISFPYTHYINKELHNESNINTTINDVKKQIQDSLNAGKTVIYDASNITLDHRKQCLSLIKDCNVSQKILIVMQADIETALVNCLEKNRSISIEKIKEKYNEFQDNYPNINEGWDKIEIINTLLRKLTKEQIKSIPEFDTKKNNNEYR